MDQHASPAPCQVVWDGGLRFPRQWPAHLNRVHFDQFLAAGFLVWPLLSCIFMFWPILASPGLHFYHFGPFWRFSGCISVILARSKPTNVACAPWRAYLGRCWLSCSCANPRPIAQFVEKRSHAEDSRLCGCVGLEAPSASEARNLRPFWDCVSTMGVWALIRLRFWPCDAVPCEGVGTGLGVPLVLLEPNRGAVGHALPRARALRDDERGASWFLRVITLVCVLQRCALAMCSSGGVCMWGSGG